MRVSPAILDDPVQFAGALAVNLWDFQRDALRRGLARRDGRFAYPIAGLSMPRGDGKTYISALVGSWRLLAGPAPQHVLSAALDLEGAKLTVRYARRFLRQLVEAGEIVERTNGFEIPSTGSLWEVSSREHTSSRGRHPTVVLYDELGFARDEELFESLLSSQASVTDPLMFITSTVGPRRVGPLWGLAQRAEGGDPDVFFEHSHENRSPLVTPEYLDRMRKLKHAVQFAREHENRWTDGEDAYVASEWIDEAMGRGWSGSDLPEGGSLYHCFVDIGLVHDPTVIAIAHDTDEVAHVDRIITHQGSKRRPVDLGMVRSELRALAEMWHCRIRVESWQGVGVAQDLRREGIRAAIRTPTAQTQADMWNTLAAELAAGRVVLPPHERLRDELLGLRVELRAGGGIKVTDRGALHQDHAVAVAGVVEMLAEARRRRPRTLRRAALGYSGGGEWDEFVAETRSLASSAPGGL